MYQPPVPPQESFVQSTAFLIWVITTLTLVATVLSILLFRRLYGTRRQESYDIYPYAGVLRLSIARRYRLFVEDIDLGEVVINCVDWKREEPIAGSETGLRFFEIKAFEYDPEYFGNCYLIIQQGDDEHAGEETTEEEEEVVRGSEGE